MGVRNHLTVLIIGTLLVLATTGAGAATYSDAKYGDPGFIFAKTSHSISQSTNGEFGVTSGGLMSVGDSNSCPTGTTLLAKYEWNDDTLEFDFVEGAAGDFIDISNVQDKKDEMGEPTSFDWAVDRSVYDAKVSALSAKYGNLIESQVFEGAYSGSFDALTDDDPAISNVLFCSAEYYQIDLVEDQPDEVINTLYSDRNRLLQSITVSSAGVVTSSVSLHSENSACFEDGDITFDPSTQAATVEVTVSDATECDGHVLSLAGYELPGQETQFHEATVDQQVFVTADTQTVGNGTTVVFEIDLDA